MRRIPPLRYARYLAEAALAYLLYGLAALMPVRVSSAAGVLLGYILYYTQRRGTRVAYRNLQLCLPERATEHTAIVRGMWRNIGRVLAEYPHLKSIAGNDKLHIVGADAANALPAGPKVFAGAHLGNWECIPLTAVTLGWQVGSIYRPLNNPFVNPLLRHIRRANTWQGALFPKSTKGGIALLRHVREGGSAGILLDQRLRDGVTVKLFGQSVRAPLIAGLLAVKYGTTIVPVRSERLTPDDAASHRVTLFPPMVIPTDGTDDERVQQVTQQLYTLFEEWVRERPEQWLWSHNRFRQ